jgi:hypothetical protein
MLVLFMYQAKKIEALTCLYNDLSKSWNTILIIYVYTMNLKIETTCEPLKCLYNLNIKPEKP